MPTDANLPTRRWLRWSIGPMMIAVGILAGLFASLRRASQESAAIAIAFSTLEEYESGFRSSDYRADRIERKGDYWHVHFRRVDGEGKPEAEAFVHDWGVQKRRQRFWEKEPKRPLFLTIDASGSPTALPARTIEEERAARAK